MLTIVSRVLVFIFLAFIGGAVFAQNTANPSEIIYERHFLTTTKGNDIGFIHILQRRTTDKDGSAVILTEKHVEQRFMRGNDRIEIIQDNSFEESPDGKPLRFSFKSSSKGENVKITGEFNWKSGKISTNSVVNKIRKSKTIDIEDNILFPYGIERIYAQNRGKLFEYATIDPGIDLQIIKVQVTKLQNETIREKQLNGAYTKYSVKTSALANIESFEWRDLNGRIMKESAPFFDTHNIAVNKNDIANISGNFDVAKGTTIPVDKEITNPEQAESIIYKISSDNMPAEDIFPSNETQFITQIDDNSTWLNVTSQISGNYSFQYPVEADNYAEYLQSGPFIITDSPQIRAVADSLVRGETDAVRIAEKMSDWVYKNIKKKDFKTNFANSVTVLELRSGDCTEHSILLAALLRAAGIPAKITTGLVYVDKPEKAFVYHMWVQAYTGRWINLDPSLPYKTFTPTHIALLESPLNTISDKTKISLELINRFPGLKVEVVNISKPIVRKIDSKNEVEVNLKNKNLLSGSVYTDIKIDEPRSTGSGIQNVGIAKEKKEKQKPDYLKEAFFAYNRGETEKALSIFKEFYKTIDPDDDAAKMKLVLKLINMSYFNFAAEIVKDINNREIWGHMINEIDKMYFPRRRLVDQKEDLLVSAYYMLNYKNDSDSLLQFTEKLDGYDYISYIRARTYLREKKFEDAEYEIKRALKIYPESIMYNFQLINILLAQNKTDEVSFLLRKMDLIAEKMGIRNHEFKKNLTAYDYWLKAKGTTTNVALNGYYQANYYKAKGEQFAALDILNKLVYKHKQPYLEELVADIFYEINQFKSAKKFYEKALKMNENSVKANIGMGNLSFLEGYDKKAEEYYHKAVKLSPNDVDALSALARFQFYTNDKAKAYDTFLKILAIDKDNKPALYNLGVILANLGKIDESEKLLKKALSLDPMTEEIWLDLAKLQIIKKDYASAVFYLKNFNSLKPDNAYYYYYLGVIFAKNDKKDEAEKCFRKALKLNPKIADSVK